mgnify:CR=1 FL=1
MGFGVLVDDLPLALLALGDEDCLRRNLLDLKKAYDSQGVPKNKHYKLALAVYRHLLNRSIQRGIGIRL